MFRVQRIVRAFRRLRRRDVGELPPNDMRTAFAHLVDVDALDTAARAVLRPNPFADFVCDPASGAWSPAPIPDRAPLLVEYEHHLRDLVPPLADVDERCLWADMLQTAIWRTLRYGITLAPVDELAAQISDVRHAGLPEEASAWLVGLRAAAAALDVIRTAGYPIRRPLDLAPAGGAR